MEKLNIGVLGVSNHFLKRVLLPLKETKHCSVLGIASRDKNRAAETAEKFNIPKAYSSYSELLSDSGIDVVYIPLPNHMHCEWIKKSVDAGKHVLCEKPLCLNAEEAKRVTQYAKNKGVKLMEAFMYKFHPLWIHVINIVQTNQIGKITYIHTSFSYNNPSKTNIRNIKEYGGGAMMDIGCYAVSVPRFILNKEPEKVVSLISRHPEFDTDTLSSAIIDFGDARATFSVGTMSESNQTVEIVGTSGKISIPLPFNTFVDVRSSITITNNIGERIVEFEPADQYGIMFDAFANAVINNQPAPVPVSDAVNNQKVVDAILRSGETNNWELIKSAVDSATI